MSRKLGKGEFSWQSPEGKKGEGTTGWHSLLSSSGEQQGHLALGSLNVLLGLFVGIWGLGNESTTRAGELGWSQIEVGALLEAPTGSLSRSDSPPSWCPWF